MTTRTTTTTISFRAPFRLSCFDHEEPAGAYRLETDEEAIDGFSRLAYRRVGTFLHVPRGSGVEVYTVDARELETALAKDQAAGAASDNH